MDIDQVHDLMEDIAEQQEVANEIQELEELEQEELDKQLLDANPAPVSLPDAPRVALPSVPSRQAKVAATADKDLEDLESWANAQENVFKYNVLRSYGMAVIRQPLYLMSELCEYGALREYLRENSKTTTDAERVEFCLGSAKGVEYLHSQRLIHRDLAIRNVLLTEEKIPKISDFGLAKVTDRYEMKEQCKTPVRYLAPETLENYIFTPKSDVFSFGMVIWEIYENGQQPHDGKNAQTIRDLTKKQQFLKLNEKAPNELRKLVSDKIFVPDPENRCNMSTVVQTIENLVK
ncbi:unnamed protein product [Caenorhabditis angaria]|uniref:Protein kinase domain-containing protein n=1 Tax=Caenorhabditis angaria TaxID=860376 RepID=A0A9P1II92_9PELO|nr:unnamed protein product [Caenorhabditis angaria]